MNRTAPIQFEYHRYLSKIIGLDEVQANFYLATEEDFARGERIDYPYRSHFYAMGLMHRGDCCLRVGARDYTLRRGTLTMVGPGILREWVRNDWSALNHTLFFTPAFFTAPFQDRFLLQYPFFRPDAHHAIDLPENDYQEALACVHLLERHAGEPGILRGLLYAYLEFARKVYSAVPRSTGGEIRQSSPVNCFHAMLQHHHRDHKALAFYAGSLGMSPKHLSEICRRDTGKSAKRLIDEYLVMEACSLLKQADLSVKETGYRLGYSEPSYFIRLFKSKTGMTPLEYRRKSG